MRALDRDHAIALEDDATTLHRLRVGVKLAAVAWFGFVLVDWLVSAYITPGSFLYLLSLRTVPGVVILACLFRLGRGPRPSRRSLYAIDALVALSTAIAIGLMGLRHGGITSPYVHGLSLVLIAESLTMPVHWRRGVWLKAAVVASFPVVVLAASLFDERVAHQLADTTTLASFGEHLFFVATVGLFVLVGGHVNWTLRRQLFESRTIDRYRLERRLEVGGMSEVWSAYHFALKRNVAVKIMQAPTADRHAALARFEREVRALSNLAHPNAVRVFDFGVTADGLWYYVMELLEGDTLGKVVEREGVLSPRRAVRLIRQACGALAEAHNKGIVHRDVKPDNIFVTRLADGQEFVKLVDFGIAKFDARDGTPRITGEGWIGGTPEYMSPEASTGQETGPEADVYSIGVVLYFALTGTTPFAGANPVELLLAHVSRSPSRPSGRLAYELPADLESLILRCLAKEPGERFASAEDLATALDRLGPLPNVTPGSRRHRHAVGTAPTLDDFSDTIPAIARRIGNGKAG